MVTSPVSFEEAVLGLRSPDPMELGRRAEQFSRHLLQGAAGYRAPQHVELTPAGALDPITRRPVVPGRAHVRIVGCAPGVTASEVLGHVARFSAGGAWVEGLQTHDVRPETYDELRQAGLQRVLGSHCETFGPTGRTWRGEHAWPSACASWRQAMAAGLHVQASLFYGQDETAEDLVGRLLQLRELQEEGGRIDGVSLVPHHHDKERETPGEITSGLDDMRLIAVARLLLDNVRHLEIPWLEFGFKAGQMALLFGADDLGPWCVDPAVTESAHLATYLAVREEEITGAIEACGRRAVCWKGYE